jgi:hypothetical protein
MGVMVTRAERDAVRGEVLTDLTALGDLTVLVDAGEYANARKHRARFEDGLALLDDLGWEDDDPRDEFELTLAPECLERAVRNLQDNALSTLAEYVGAGFEERDLADRASVAAEAYWRILREAEGADR